MTRSKKKNEKTNIKKIIITLFFFVFIAMFGISIYKIIEWAMNNEENKKILEEIKNTVDVEVETTEEQQQTIYNIDFKSLKEKNEDIVAWIKVNGTNIEYPIVQSSDNDYYLKRNLNKEYNAAGWIFADYKNKLDGSDKNIIIYGHNIKDGSMFGSLKSILQEEWYNNEENYIIDFITETEQQKYEVFSVYQIKDESYYIKTDFKNNEFEEFIKTLQNRSIKDFNVEMTTEDNILTLSTCANNNKYRVVLHARKIN